MQAAPCLDLGDHIHQLDTGYTRPQFDACYLVVEGDAAAFIDTGTAPGVPALLQALAELGLQREQVRYIIPTHVHLDHAGGAGELMRQCPNATLVAHPKGVPHLVDPSRLIAGATAVYGEETFKADYGAIVPVPAERAHAAQDGETIDLNGRRLRFYDTPGHANHHGCIFDERSRSLFTGDTGGISYREFDTAQGSWIFATTTPVAFDPEGWLRSLDKLQALNPQALCLTHFGRLDATPALFDALRASVKAMRGMALAEEAQPDGRLAHIQQRVADHFTAQLAAHGCTLPVERQLELLAIDIDLNGQGLEVWLQRRAKAAQTAPAAAH